VTREIRETFLAVSQAFEASGIPYAIVGAFAVSAWGAPRTTEDVDVIAAVDAGALEPLLEALRARDLTLRREDVLAAIREGMETGRSTLVRVDGEEDLAALPAIAAAPDGASVLYGQPGEGVVHVTVDDDVRDRVRSLLDRMDGDSDRALALVE
jgi:hypothetical protein